MYRSDPFSCPEHLAGISDAGFWSPLEQAAMMRASIGITGAVHPLTNPAYQRALAEWRPDNATDSLSGARGSQPQSLSKVLKAAADAPMGESTYFTVGAVLGWWKIRTSKTGQRATFTLEGSEASIRCVMWSNALKRHGDDLPKDGDLVVAVGRVQTRSFTRTETDEATGEEVTTTHYRHEAVVDRLSKVEDPIRAALNAAEHQFRARGWWRALDDPQQGGDPTGEKKADTIRRMVGFTPPPTPDPTRKGLHRLSPVEIDGPGRAYAAGASLALGILRHCKADDWKTLVQAMNAVADEDAAATPEQQVTADRFGTLVIDDEQWSLLAMTPLEFIGFKPRYSVAVCSDCGHPIDAGPKGTPRKCTALPFCGGTLSGKVTPAKAAKVEPAPAATAAPEPEPANVRHLRAVPDPTPVTPGASGKEVLPCEVLLAPFADARMMSAFRPVVFGRDGRQRFEEVPSSVLSQYAHITYPPYKVSDLSPDAVVLFNEALYGRARAAVTSRVPLSLTEFPDLLDRIRADHRELHPGAQCYQTSLAVVPKA